MDYKRKIRNITYHSDSCKMYLRHDFNHKCAYCGVIEESMALIPEVADKCFEKDHFDPQNNDSPEVHTYSNLYYSCSSCNNKKDAIMLSLDPCVDAIFSGETPHIKDGTPKTDYILNYTTAKGKAYIEALELNSQYHIAIRKNQYAWKHAQDESLRIFRDLEARQVLDPSDLQQIAISLNLSLDTEPYKCMCGGSKFAIDFAAACNHLKNMGCNPVIMFEENEMDIKADVGADTYWGTVHISESIKECRIKTSILRERIKKYEPYGIFIFIPKSDTMYFHKIDSANINWNKKEYRSAEYIPI